MSRDAKSRRLFVGLFVVCASFLGVAEGQENIDPEETGAQYAWSENSGWFNAELDTDGDGTPDEGVTVTDTRLLGWLWSENAGWVSLSCVNTGSCGLVNYGVTNDGCGLLSGHGWGENVGWVKFSHAEGGVTIDPQTGQFSGHAWGENLGWVRFQSLGVVDYGVVTAWTRSVPAGVPFLTLTHEADSTTLAWNAVADASVYDVVEGDLAYLAATGDLMAAVSACAGEDLLATSTTHSVTPDPAGGHFFVVRGQNCGGAGSYDSGGPAQSGPRDPEINASPHACGS